MKKLAASFLAGAALTALALTALAQQLAPGSFTGTETWVVALGGPGGTSEFVNTAMMRNTQGILTFAGGSAITMNNNSADVCLTAQPAAAANITLPPNPFDGQVVEVINCTTSNFATNVFSILANSGGANATLLGGSIALTTLGAGASRELRYSLVTNTWYTLR